MPELKIHQAKHAALGIRRGPQVVCWPCHYLKHCLNAAQHLIKAVRNFVVEALGNGRTSFGLSSVA